MRHAMLRIVSVLFVCMTSAAAFAEEELVITNPNLDAYLKSHPLETKPRDPAVIDAEKKLIVEAAQSIVDYANANGVEATLAEVTKGKDGAFAQYHNIGPQFRMMIFQFFDKDAAGNAGDVFIIQAHNLMTPLIGVKLLLNALVDLSGWTFVMDARNAAFSEQGRGWVLYDFWADELWAAAKTVRFINYVQALDLDQRMIVMTCVAVDE